MRSRTLAAVLVASLLASPPVRADNPMGYRLLSTQEASGLPRRGGALGLDIERAQQVTDAGMTFDILRVKQARRGSAGAQAGLAPGDQIIAVDGRVFASIAAFAAYVGSTPPGQQISLDYIPAGGGPQQAERLAVTVGAGGQAAPPPLPTQATGTASPAPSTGMSTGTKVAIGLGALFGCYELGCFSRRSNNATVNGQPAR